MLLLLPAIAHVYGIAGLGIFAAISSLNAFLGALDLTVEVFLGAMINSPSRDIADCSASLAVGEKVMLHRTIVKKP